MACEDSYFQEIYDNEKETKRKSRKLKKLCFATYLIVAIADNPSRAARCIDKKLEKNRVRK